MERNYDEIISDILRQLDRQGDRLTEQRKLYNKHSASLMSYARDSQKFYSRLARTIETLRASLNTQLREHKLLIEEQGDRVIHTAAILDRVIKLNKLKL